MAEAIGASRENTRQHGQERSPHIFVKAVNILMLFIAVILTMQWEILLTMTQVV